MRIHHQRWITRALLILVVACGVSACAGNQGAASTQGSTALRVENDLVPSTSMRIYAVASSGGRSMVGTVNPGSTTTLYFNPIGAGGEYRFVAELDLGREIVSNPVNFSPGSTIEWRLRSNLATVASSP